ncbi:Krr1-domain-containing protein [Epithele typhae]|uniref:Krr1-domain-containing protein n=1 Tax=Epithele typhae TaxID=378194 RepID=UPI0020073A90|nr:Krr1-domain-containing protein [Epithele typhae]KAH9925911.1 Krr1-domain-containing protein [Epithele typhae]
MFSDDSDIEDTHDITINEHYAKAFEYRKEREELAKLKDKYGSDYEGEDDDEEGSEDGESEDEDGEELTPAVDAAILRTLARIKRKDPAIYEDGKDVFEEERQRTGDVRLARAQKRKDKSKPLTFRQAALDSALRGSRSPTPEPAPLTHVQEQARLRKDTIAAFHGAVDDEDEEELLVPREKTKDETEREEEEYRAFLQREVGEDLSGLITVEGDVKQEQGAARKRRSTHVQEITKGKGAANEASDEEDDASVKSDSDGTGDGNELLDEDEFEEVADRFESSYNFRFEEPGAQEIAWHPRNLASTVRREDTTRKEAREKKKARKEEELLKKREEVKRLKALKMKELRAKLERIGHEGGESLADVEALQTLDLEADWDPEAHDRKMAELYANDAPAGGWGDFDGDEGDMEKPTWDDNIDITDIVADDGGDPSSSKKKKKKKKKSRDDDGDAGGVDVDEMDAAVERKSREEDEEEWDGTEEMRKRKLEEYMDEIYGLDFNDMVAGMPTRFRYAKVEDQDFGLSPAEILTATDAELNVYMGLKKYAPYRKEGRGRTWDGQRTARLKELKSSLRERGAAGGRGENDGDKEKVKKRKGKKERLREKAAAAAGEGEGGGDGEGEEEEVAPKKRKRDDQAAVDDESGTHESATKKKRRRHKKSGVAAAE